MILLSLQGVTKSFGTNEVLRDASLTLQDGQRMGLVGVNGCGKSTLMKIIAGLESADDGVITMQKGLRLGYLAQQGEVGEGCTVLEELESVFDPVVEMEQQLREMERRMAEVGSDETLLRHLGSQYDQLTREFERRNGYGWRSTVQGVLAGLGFRKEQQSQLASLLSGGERTRLCLGRMLLTEPDLLLLDEPTNHLDIASREWIEEAVEAFDGTLLFVSHDRYFINRFATRVWELADGTITDYPMGFAQYRSVKEAEAREKPVVTTAPEKKGDTRVRSENRNQRAARRQLTICETAIGKLEKAIAALDAEMEQYACDAVKLGELFQQKQETEELLEQEMLRWEELSLVLEENEV